MPAITVVTKSKPKTAV